MKGGESGNASFALVMLGEGLPWTFEKQMLELFLPLTVTVFSHKTQNVGCSPSGGDVQREIKEQVGLGSHLTEEVNH